MKKTHALIRVILWVLLYTLALKSIAQNNSEQLLNLEARINVMDEELKSAVALSEQKQPNEFNPSISVIGDLAAQYGFDVKDEGHHGFSNGLKVKELEFEFRGSIDPIAEALIAFAIGQHGKKIHLHLEEAFINFTPWPILIKVGRFKAAIGRMNRLHGHNLPQITEPRAVQLFLGDEGFVSQGVSLSASHAFSFTTALTITAEALMGERLRLQDKEAADLPSGVLNLWLHQEAKPDHLLDFGLSSFLGWQGNASSGLFGLYGADFHYSYVPTGYGQDPIFLLGLEAYLNHLSQKDQLVPGGFLWAQSKLVGSSFLGLRYDLAKEKAENIYFEHALGFYLGYYHTEFLRFRLGYEHVMPKLDSLAGDHRLMASINFVLGSHPVEPYFANR